MNSMELNILIMIFIGVIVLLAFMTNKGMDSRADKSSEIKKLALKLKYSLFERFHPHVHLIASKISEVEGSQIEIKQSFMRQDPKALLILGEYRKKQNNAHIFVAIKMDQDYFQDLILIRPEHKNYKVPPEMSKMIRTGVTSKMTPYKFDVSELKKQFLLYHNQGPDPLKKTLSIEFLFHLAKYKHFIVILSKDLIIAWSFDKKVSLEKQIITMQNLVNDFFNRRPIEIPEKG